MELTDDYLMMSCTSCEINSDVATDVSPFCGNSPVGSSHNMPVTRSFEVLFDLLSKPFIHSLTPLSHISSGDNGPLAVQFP